MSNSEAIQSITENAWFSKRLTYRAIQDTEADLDFLSYQVANDSVLRALWTPKLFRPQSAEMVRPFFDTLRQRLFSAYICLDTSEDTLEGKNIVHPRPIGFISLKHEDPDDAQHASALLAITIIDEHQGNGYGPEAINWVLDWGFRFARLHRIGLFCFSFNHRGQKVYERLGFSKEGVTRENLWFNRGWHDTFHYGMLESEWEKLRVP